MEREALKKLNDVVVNEEDWMIISIRLQRYKILMLMWSSV